ncbi:prepilin peptidase [Streptomyces albiflavescens]|uniref:Prepilin peptidase n=1 Tax=Streptomyces albiflavescens TaxID=1623582 RepID=A0A918D8H2_9ACTN|nr:A24 family peptidase [Streptomyces albiflavescens]GGN86082.1 prepilin peptidase [Streptomyces albiflavescens]
MRVDLDVWLTGGAALWGAAAGSLVPRAAYRFSVQPDEAWRDRCPEGHAIVGVAGGWLGLARCGRCAGSVSASPASPTTRTAEAVRGDAGQVAAGRAPASYGPRALFLSLATAFVCAGLALATGTRPELAVWLVLAPLGVLLAVVDFGVQRLPDVLTLPLAGAALALLGVVAVVPEHAGEWLTALFGALALGGGYFVLFLVNPNGMGFGDVKLALGLGALLGWYGWSVVFLGTFAGFLFGGLYGMGLVMVRRAGRKTSIPFGPFLIAGAYVGLLIGAYAA